MQFISGIIIFYWEAIHEKRFIEYINYVLTGLVLVYALVKFIKTSDFAYIAIAFAVLATGIFTLLSVKPSNNKYIKAPI